MVFTTRDFRDFPFDGQNGVGPIERRGNLNTQGKRFAGGRIRLPDGHGWLHVIESPGVSGIEERLENLHAGP